MFEIEKIKGIIVPIVTPVEETGIISEPKLRCMVDHVIEGGVHGILAFGSNSEFYMFNHDEMIEATKIILNQTRNRVPVFFGIGDIRTSRAIDLAKRADELNVTGISILQPMFIQPTEESLYQHYKAIATAIPHMMILIYNNPGRTGYSLTLDLIDQLAHDVDNIIGIKDSSGDITFLSELVRRTQDIDFQVLAGKDTIIFPALCVGAVGSVCSTANMFPKLVSSIYDCFVNGDYSIALENQFRLNPVRLSQDKASFPAATKDMSTLMGLDVGIPIPPTNATTGALLDAMKLQMKKSNLL